MHILPLAGLVGLLLPGLSAPPLYGSGMMLGAGLWYAIALGALASGTGYALGIKLVTIPTMSEAFKGYDGTGLCQSICQ